MSMKMMFRNLVALMVLWVAMAEPVAAGVVEEETWYGADGKVVKSVKRTLTGTDARESQDWEPQWVTRERQRDQRVVRRYSSSGRAGSGYAYGSYWGGGYYYSGSRTSCYRSRGRSGFTGYYRGGSGGSRWGVSYRSPGLSIRYCR